MPPFPPGMTWAGEEPAAAERLTARGPLLVHFFEVGELSSVLSLRHVDAWARRYADAGLTTVGVHTPRSDLARAPGAFAAAIERLGIGFPVLSDTSYLAWQAYGCKGWPSLFLWGRGGRLRWFHFGVGGLAATEEAIRAELREADGPGALPGRVHDRGAEGRKLARPSDEVFPGGAHDRPWSPAPGEPLEVEYAGAGAWAALDGEGEVEISVDGGRPRALHVGGPGLYELCGHDRHGRHEVALRFGGPVRVWSVSFAPGPR